MTGVGATRFRALWNKNVRAFVVWAMLWLAAGYGVGTVLRDLVF